MFLYLLELLLLLAITLALPGDSPLWRPNGRLGSGVKELSVELERLFKGLWPLYTFYFNIFGSLNFAERLVSFSNGKSS